MKVTLWGTRGSIAAPGPETVRYGGNTACVSVEAATGEILVLDGGTGVRRLGVALSARINRFDIFLTHLHMDHIQGLGFFRPLYKQDADVHIWGPPSTTMMLRDRLARYLSPPLFPVRLRDLKCRLTLHDVTKESFQVGPFTIDGTIIAHPGSTVGYRIREGAKVVTYIPDHEPALGTGSFPREPDWTSGFDLSEGADLLIHDSQYFAEEYDDHVGWGHSTIDQSIALADLAGVRRLVTFHHDPDHTDDDLDRALAEAVARTKSRVEVDAGTEGAVFEV